MISDKDILNNLSYERDPQGILWCLPGALFPDGRALKVLLPDNSRGHIHAFINAVRGEYNARENSKKVTPPSAPDGGVFNFDDLGSQDAGGEAVGAADVGSPQADSRHGVEPRYEPKTGVQDVEADVEGILRDKHRRLCARKEALVEEIQRLVGTSNSLSRDIQVLEKLLATLNADRGAERPQGQTAAPSANQPAARRRGRPPKKAASPERAGDPQSTGTGE